MPYVYYFYEPFEQPASLFHRLADYRVDDTSIRMLDLSKRSYNALRRAHITTIGQIALMRPNKMLKLHAVGCKSLAEIEACLEKYIANYPPPLIEPSFLLETLPKVASHEALDSWQQMFHLLATDKTGIEVLMLSHRTSYFLWDAKLTTVGALASLKQEELAQVRNLGKVAINEIERKLKSYLTENFSRFQAASAKQ